MAAQSVNIQHMRSDAQRIGGYGPPEWTVTDRLRKAREIARLTQQELADKIDVSLRTIGNYENPEYESERKDLVTKQWALATGQAHEWIITGVISQGPEGGSTQPVRRSGWTATVVPLRRDGLARAA